MAKELDSQGSIGARKSSDMLSRGETTHYDLRVAIAPSSSAVTDSLDFQVVGTPLQIQFASATHVRCARHKATEEERGLDDRNQAACKRAVKK